MNMRRLCSILALFAVLCPVASPLWAAVIHPAQPASCHRMPMATTEGEPAARPAHHCHDMDGNEQVPTAETNPAVMNASSSEKCPMNCCLQAAPPTVAALPADSFLLFLVAARTALHVVPDTFTSAGFSSHTDRGPPGL